MSNSPNEIVNLNQKLTESLLQVNSLSYTMPPQLGIASRATHTIDYSQQSSYKNGETIVVDVQSGTSFVDPQSSYFRFEVKPVASGYGFASGSSANIFSRITVRSKTGKEITRLESANVITKFLERWSYSSQWLDSIGKVQGYSKTKFVVGSVSNTLTYGDEVPSTGKIYIIPVQSIVPCFNVIGSKLLPPQMMSGLRIEFTLSDPETAFATVNQGTLTTLASYQVNNFTCNWKSFKLADQFLRKINEMASNGLNLMHKEYFHTITSSQGTQVNYDIKKACSKALKCMIISRIEADITASGRDSFRASPYDYSKYQAHIGAEYVPNQPVTVNDMSSNGNAESYYYTNYAMDKLEHFHPPSVTPDEFTGYAVATGSNDIGWNNGMIAFNLNKSNVSDLAGSALNNSRSLLIDLTRTQTTTLRIDSYLSFLRLAKWTLTNCVVLD